MVIEEVEETEYFKDKTHTDFYFYVAAQCSRESESQFQVSLVISSITPVNIWLLGTLKSSTENERTTSVIKTDTGVEVLFRQIAGAVARRIRWYIKPGDKAGTRRMRMGFIKFGSRVDVFVPSRYGYQSRARAKGFGC